MIIILLFKTRLYSLLRNGNPGVLKKYIKSKINQESSKKNKKKTRNKRF